MKISMFVAVSLLAACGSKKDDKGDPGTSSSKAVEGKGDGPFAEFGSNEEVLKKWQGAWVVETGSIGHYEAWEVKGTQVTTWDGKTEQVRELKINSPCDGKVIEKSNGGSSSNHLTFVFEGDTLHTGMGSAGLKKGDKYLACGSGRIFVFDGKTCVAYEDNFGRWENKPTECKLDGGKLVAKRPGMGDMSSTFNVVGDVLMDNQMKGNKVQKAASFAEAKSALETFKK